MGKLVKDSVTVHPGLGNTLPPIMMVYVHWPPAFSLTATVTTTADTTVVDDTRWYNLFRSFQPSPFEIATL